MLKNVKELNEREIVSLNEAYTEYFKEYASRPIPGIVNKWGNMISKSNSKSAANKMIEYILKGERIGVIDINGLDVKAFIIGRMYENGEAWISHFYIDKDIYGNQRRSLALSTFQGFVKLLKQYNAKTVQAEASYYEPRFLDILDTLYFEEKERYSEDAVIYEKQL